MSQDTLRLIFLNILGWSFYAWADTTAKYLSSTYSVSQMLMIGSGVAAIILGSWILIEKGWRGFLSPKLKWHLLRALGVAGISYCVVNSFTRIPLADFYGVAFTSPFLVLIFACFFLKEYVGWQRWVAVVFGFAGVLILAGPEFMDLNVGYVFAAISVVLVATTAIIIRKIGKNEYLPLYAFYPPLFITTLNAPMALSDFVVPVGFDYGIFLFYGFLIIGGLLATTYTIAHVKEMAIVAPFHYTQIIWGVLFGYFLFGDTPTLRTYIGLVLIISAGLYMIYREYRLNHPSQNSNDASVS